MATFEYSVFYRDILGGETTKIFTGDFVDYATARTAADALLADLAAATDAHIYRDKLAEVSDIAGAPNAGSTVFMRASATVNLSGGDKGNLQVPAPVAAMFSGNSLITSTGPWPALTANFATDWTISDGEFITGTVVGKRVYVRSGRTNLPS